MCVDLTCAHSVVILGIGRYYIQTMDAPKIVEWGGTVFFGGGGVMKSSLYNEYEWSGHKVE